MKLKKYIGLLFLPIFLFSLASAANNQNSPAQLAKEVLRLNIEFKKCEDEECRANVQRQIDKILDFVKSRDEKYQNAFAATLNRLWRPFFRPGDPKKVENNEVNMGEYQVIGNDVITSGGSSWGICSIVIFYKDDKVILVLHTPFPEDVQKLQKEYKPDSAVVVFGPIGTQCGKNIVANLEKKGVKVTVEHVQKLDALIVVAPRAKDVSVYDDRFDRSKSVSPCN